ncbi:DNA-binding domain-containing protein [Sphingomonas sanxanigenens]|uniref:Putative DNA-binding domain-containing protein n=1 Tax=Sphingomonas sanxanigenens DSM 19645 = NX02 TaxID=1123269 RepID=W0A240_9SPHN|nr:DNA-binding domain-containing protein [Sphingomonas sanxanigenens]AHE51974.1 hypothetical protein NX02_01040 [Sphingomonas sanxanigenens DSM 19645 = NX02]
MSLLVFQRDMRAWLVREDEAAAARIGPDAAPGLRVHQNNYRAQLVACLETGFERTRAWIGDDAFRAAAAFHIDRVPPGGWTLDAYGQDFPSSLALIYPADPEVGELAWIDLALDEAFVGPDAPAITAADLADIDWDRAVLRMVPTIDIGDLATNADRIWTALAAGEEPPPPYRRDAPGAILVWRQGLVPRFRAIDTDEQSALIRARAGLPFTALCAIAVEALGEQPGIARAGEWLGRWVSDGLIRAILCGDDRAVHD